MQTSPSFLLTPPPPCEQQKKCVRMQVRGVGGRVCATPRRVSVAWDRVTATTTHSFLPISPLPVLFLLSPFIVLFILFPPNCSVPVPCCRPESATAEASCEANGQARRRDIGKKADRVASPHAAPPRSPMTTREPGE